MKGLEVNSKTGEREAARNDGRTRPNRFSADSCLKELK
jgi:hypothetical protein